MFTLDYALWFDQMLPGLERLNVPIPRGGTANHFNLSVLRELHAWDPFNVTEDADLGIRLTQKGYRVGVVDSTTFEEASCHAGNFIRQRLRWIKGYMQTFLVHTRRPLHLMRTTGALGFLGFLFFVGGTALSGLLNPMFWALYLTWLAASALRLVHLPEHARPDPARLAQAHSLRADRLRLLGPHLARRLQGAVAAAASSVLLGKDAARRLQTFRAGAGGGRRERVVSRLPPLA